MATVMIGQHGTKGMSVMINHNGRKIILAGDPTNPGKMIAFIDGQDVTPQNQRQIVNDAIAEALGQGGRSHRPRG